MSAQSSPASSRPTLPGIQEMFSDLQFNSLRQSPLQGTRDIAATSSATRSPLSSDRSEERSRRSRRENWTSSPPGFPDVATVPRSSCGRDGGAGPLGPYSGPVAGSVPPASYRSMSQYGSPGGRLYEAHSAGRHDGPLTPPYPSHASTRANSALRDMSERNLPTYILSPEECPPDDDRRHGCGICHRRFNRPSSLRIHMNSHTGDQPFECPYPGCSRRFSVNSNMRRHYRNHRDGHSFTPPLAYPALYYRQEPPQMLYRVKSSPSASSALSFSDSDDHEDSPVTAPNNRLYQFSQGRTRSVSEAYPPRQDRPTTRARACTIAGCDCREAPAALRPAFPQGSTSAIPPRSR